MAALPSGRWSSSCQSHLHLKRSAFQGTRGFIIKSDGAGDDWGLSLDDSSITADSFQEMAEARAALDDISFIALRQMMEMADTALSPLALSKAEPPADQPPQRPQPPQTLSPQHTRTRESGTEQIRQRARLAGAARSPASDWRRSVWTFAAGIVVGVLLMLLLYSGAARKSSDQAPHSPEVDGSASSRQQASLSSRPAATVNLRRVNQKGFLKSYEKYLKVLPLSERKNGTGEALICIHVEGSDVKERELAELQLIPKGGAPVNAKPVTGEGGQLRLAHLTGLKNETPVTIQLLDSSNGQLFESTQNMLGREDKGSNDNPFLGYYEMKITFER